MFVAKKQIRLVLSLMLMAVLCMLPIQAAGDAPPATPGEGWWTKTKIFGVSIGVILFVAVIIIIGVVIWRRKKRS